jgi:FSR family fosmidomycin resistance protein-like MFS transporter
MTAVQEDLFTAETAAAPADHFQTATIATVASAHGAHDTFFAFLPTILPILIKNLGMTTTQAGLLSACTQIPNLLQPVIGNLADRKNLRLLVILAPTFSGILISMVGLAPTFGLASLLLLLAGFSTACFHSIAPAMVSARSGDKPGRGMGFFMVGGELGFGLGPLIVVAAISVLTFKGLPWMMTLGMLASVILWTRLKDISTVRPATEAAGLPVKEALRQLLPIMVPTAIVITLSGFLMGCFVNFLPTFMSTEGVPFALAGISLTVVELGATVGVFMMGLFSDRLGQRNVAIIGVLASAVFGFGFLSFNGWLQVVMLVGVGLTAFIPNPAFLAIIQPRFTQNRALANGVYMSCSFVLRSLVVILIGVLSDRFGMRNVFYLGLALSVAAVPVLFFLPER